MDTVRDETETDRTQAALARYNTQWPLAKGRVAITVSPEAATSIVGQRLLTVLTNVLARMKGVVEQIMVDGLDAATVLPTVPLAAGAFQDQLGGLSTQLNHPGQPYPVDLTSFPAGLATVKVSIGTPSRDADVVVGADGWRALLGQYAEATDWHATAPFGAALAASMAAVEVFKLLLRRNGVEDDGRRLAGDLAYSAFDLGVNSNAGLGPDIRELKIKDTAVVGCGAGGSAALYVLAMQPGLNGDIALVEPQRQKLSNLNRYLMATATDIHEERHKLGVLANHLARYAPSITQHLYPVTWETLDERPWRLLVSTVDTVPARWAIQDRAAKEAEIIDAAVLDLLYSVVRFTPGGYCVLCRFPYDPEFGITQRAKRWGETPETIKRWEAERVLVTGEMIARLARTQSRPVDHFIDLEGSVFTDIPALTECGNTRLHATVPSQAPVLPMATTLAGTLVAAEIAKHHIAPESQLDNCLDHDTGRAPARPRVTHRPVVHACSRH